MRCFLINFPFLYPLYRISRDVKKQPTDFHFFTSHFYTTLADEGPKAVESWTAKKNIDIFKKKLIFVPINKDLHWSLCVVVNPGAIMNSLEKKPDDPLACLIFLDSLNMHRKHVVQKKICAWLNSEWARIRSKSQEQKKSPFHRNSLRIFSPKGKPFSGFMANTILCCLTIAASTLQYLTRTIAGTVEYLFAVMHTLSLGCGCEISHLVTLVYVPKGRKRIIRFTISLLTRKNLTLICLIFDVSERN